MNNQNGQRSSSLLIVFWSLVGVFLVIVSQFFVPAVSNLFMGSKLFLLPMGVFFLLGLALIFLTIKGKVERRLKKFLILTGLSASGFFVSVFLHNLFYALGIVTGQIIGLNYLVEFLDIAFFLIGIFACPLGFLIGLIGSLILLVKRRQ